MLRTRTLNARSLTETQGNKRNGVVLATESNSSSLLNLFQPVKESQELTDQAAEPSLSRSQAYHQ